jgi:hypothetical protein
VECKCREGPWLKQSNGVLKLPVWLAFHQTWKRKEGERLKVARSVKRTRLESLIKHTRLESFIRSAKKTEIYELLTLCCICGLDYFWITSNQGFFQMNFSCLQKRTSFSLIVIKQVANTFILKGINGTSIRNVLECHHVRGTRTTWTCIFTEKRRISAPFSTRMFKIRLEIVPTFYLWRNVTWQFCKYKKIAWTPG